MKNIGNILTKRTKKAARFIKNHRRELFAISLMAIFYAVPDAVGNAASMDNISAGSVTADVGINGLSTPLQKLGSAFTGNIPKIGVSIAAAAGGLSWALGTESQITKYALRCAAGGGIAMAAPAAVNSLTGCLM